MTRLAAAAVLALGLAACSSSDDPPPPAPPPVEPGPTAYEAGKAAIMAAATEADAQAAYDAIDLSDVSGEEAASLMMALNTRLADLATASAYTRGKAAIMAATTAEAAQAAYDAIDKTAITGEQVATLQGLLAEQLATIATAGREADQKMALTTAAGMIDLSDLSTQADVNAANAAIAALEAALAAATDVSDADKAMYEGRVTAAKTAVASAQGVLDHASQTTALMGAVAALQAIDLTDLSTQEKIDAAKAAIYALQMALDAATELSAAEKAAAMTELNAADRNVMIAQGNFDIQEQLAALTAAAAVLAGIDLNDLMTQDDIDAAEKAIAGVNLALEAAVDLTDAQKLDATVDVTVAERRVMAAQETLNTNIESQRTALMTASTALAAIDLDDLDTAEKITAAKDAVQALKTALDNASHVSDTAMYESQLETADETVKMAETGMGRSERMTAQRSAIMTTVTAARTAVGMVDDDATDAQVTAADNAIAALKEAIDGAEDLPEGDAEVAMAQGTLETLEGQLASAKTSRTAAMAEDDRKQNEANAATAAKLYAGIAAQSDGVTATVSAGTVLTEGQRGAAYNDVNVPAGNDPQTPVDTRIMVGIGTATPVALTEDKKTTVADLHDWEGKRYTAEPDDDGMYEAVVYSNVGEPTEGLKFGSPTDNNDYQYTLNTGDNTELTIDDTNADPGWAARVASPSFDHSAGVKEFELGTNLQRVMLAGSYHGVSGTYYCTPATDSACAAQVAENGFTLGGTADTGGAFTTTGGTWTFKPTDRNARVMSVPDSTYASYGWWIHKSEDGKTFTASAFVDVKGGVGTAAGQLAGATGLTALQGTATYMGGAAGKYALSSSTGGTNDAGHFTARAMLEADFGDNTITGEIDTFMGADGKMRDWEVELKEAAIADTGGITRVGADELNNDTVWTIGDNAADASGEWSGTLYDNTATETDRTGVPKVGTGTFYTTFGTDGRMVGAFGVNRQ